MLKDISVLPPLVVRLIEASPPSDHTDRNSVRDAPTKCEFTLVFMFTIKITLWDSNH